MTASDRSAAPSHLARHRLRKSSPLAAIGQGLSHPVIDTDLHTPEFAPLLQDILDRFYTEANPDFFKGSVVDAKLAQRRAAVAERQGTPPR